MQPCLTRSFAVSPGKEALHRRNIQTGFKEFLLAVGCAHIHAHERLFGSCLAPRNFFCRFWVCAHFSTEPLSLAQFPSGTNAGISTSCAGDYRKRMRKEVTMEITRKQLKSALESLEPWKRPDYRKLANGRIVRFVDWRRARR